MIRNKKKIVKITHNNNAILNTGLEQPKKHQISIHKRNQRKEEEHKSSTRRRNKPKTHKRNFVLFHLYVFINAGANWCCFFTKPQTTTISLTSSSFFLSPFFSIHFKSNLQNIQKRFSNIKEKSVLLL